MTMRQPSHLGPMRFGKCSVRCCAVGAMSTSLACMRLLFCITSRASGQLIHLCERYAAMCRSCWVSLQAHGHVQRVGSSMYRVVLWARGSRVPCVARCVGYPPCVGAPKHTFTHRHIGCTVEPAHQVGRSRFLFIASGSTSQDQGAACAAGNRRRFRWWLRWWAGRPFAACGNVLMWRVTFVFGNASSARTLACARATDPQQMCRGGLLVHACFGLCCCVYSRVVV